MAQRGALTFFLPLRSGTGGKAGSPAATLVIRAMAVGEITARDFIRVIWREMRIGLVLGLAMAAAIEQDSRVAP